MPERVRDGNKVLLGFLDQTGLASRASLSFLQGGFAFVGSREGLGAIETWVINFDL